MPFPKGVPCDPQNLAKVVQMNPNPNHTSHLDVSQGRGAWEEVFLRAFPREGLFMPGVHLTGTRKAYPQHEISPRAIFRLMVSIALPRTLGNTTRRGTTSPFSGASDGSGAWLGSVIDQAGQAGDAVCGRGGALQHGVRDKETQGSAVSESFKQGDTLNVGGCPGGP